MRLDKSQEAIDVNKRRTLVGAASFLGASLVPSLDIALATSGEQGPIHQNMEADFQLLTALRERLLGYALDISGRLGAEGRKDLSTDEQMHLYELGLAYGTAFREFEEKHGVGKDLFGRGPEHDMRIELHRWITQNTNATQIEKDQRLNDFLRDILIVGDAPESDVAHVAGLRAFFCGYFPTLCPPSN